MRRLNGPINLYYSTSHLSGVIENFAQPDEFSRTIHHHSLRVGACGATDLLCSRSASLAGCRSEGTYALEVWFSAVAAYGSPIMPLKWKRQGDTRRRKVLPVHETQHDEIPAIVGNVFNILPFGRRTN